jgi:hypothetical protein
MKCEFWFLSRLNGEQKFSLLHAVVSDFGNLSYHETNVFISALHLRSLQLRDARKLNTARF